MFLNIKSDERDSDDTIALDRGLHFKSPVYEISGQLEFNFLPYQPEIHSTHGLHLYIPGYLF